MLTQEPGLALEQEQAPELAWGLLGWAREPEWKVEGLIAMCAIDGVIRGTNEGQIYFQIC